MSCLKAGFSVYGSSEIIMKNRARGSFRVCSSIETLQFKKSISREFLGKPFDLSDQKPFTNYNIKTPKVNLVNAQPSVCIGKAQRWWEKTLQPNMVEIQSAQELMEFLNNAGDKLVILDFYSPSCGGCKTLHPKICQLAEMNPNAIFLKLNYEQHKAMCYALHVHVLPFFRFYRGAEGRVCSFSCTNATIKKFKDALAKHGSDECGSLGPAKGLDESEVLALASIGLISTDLVLNANKDNKMDDLVINEIAMSTDELSKEDNAMVMAFS
ncbi:hypothetical protein DH2020_043034 [Rehmannia glutinosa]|uniref:Thioredoxin domain-containing protein n=1 Tax=Rehmannia glutinosa TaxID=99300 RepID=A0ABR0ULQ5_REHGL